MQPCGHLCNRGQLCLSAPLSMAKTSLFLLCPFPNQKGRNSEQQQVPQGTVQRKEQEVLMAVISEAKVLGFLEKNI